ncbi:hypothetical protein Gpo141_00008532 [Globisporangium polare]
MIWTPLALGSVVLSCIGTTLIVHKLFRDWDLRVSCVRWLFFLFFVYLWFYSVARAVFYAWIVAQPASAIVDVYPSADGVKLTYEELDRLGIHAIMHMKASRNAFVVFVLLFGDAAHFGVAIWIFPLVYELSKIARKSMDRGAEKESARIRIYAVAGHVALAAFIVTDVTLAFASGGIGYTKANHDCLLFVYVVQILTLAYMIVLLVLLRVNGRKYETVQGQFVVSPVFMRLHRIMVIYVVFAFQFQVSSLIIYGSNTRLHNMLTFISVSLVIYNLTGFALSVTTGCSQTCVLKFCGCCIPDDMEAQLIHGGPLEGMVTPLETPFHESHGVTALNGSGNAGAGGANPPTVNPVFVFTDIESSSALWGIGDGQVMKLATELHDSILRGLLAKYRGYEITTAGDAFQLAFHSIREATSYCLDAQIQLVMAKWPKELHGLVPATEKKRSGGYRLIFNGLRVRMGIHDASESEGTLVQDIHAVTGKMTYTGASEVIANEIGDLGSGGQILVTRRVAQWLAQNEALVDIPFKVERVGTHVIPQVNGHLEVFQVVPELFAKRKKYFGSIIKRTETMYSLYTDRAGRATSARDREPMTPPYTPPRPISPSDEYHLMSSTRSLPMLQHQRDSSIGAQELSRSPVQ